MKITITPNKAFDKNVFRELARHINSLCRLLADDMVKVEFDDDYNAFGAKKP
jgi:hypothetical protein